MEWLLYDSCSAKCYASIILFNLHKTTVDRYYFYLYFTEEGQSLEILYHLP